MLWKIAFLSLLLSAAADKNNDAKIAFISSFVKSQSKPTTIIVWYNCFDAKHKLDLIKNVFTYTMFSEQDSLNESDFKINPQHNLFVADLTCTNTPEKIIEKVNSMTSSFSLLVCDSISILSSLSQIDASLFAHPYRWLMFADDNEVFSRVQALPDSDVLIAIATNDGFDLKQFYRTEISAREIHYENYGSWSLESGIIDERETKIISRRRENLRGKVITTSYVHLDRKSKNHLTDYVDKNVDPLLKLNYLAINDVLDKINATKKEIFQMNWGYFNERTKKWSGMIGDIVHKDADIGGDFVSCSRGKNDKLLCFP